MTTVVKAIRSACAHAVETRCREHTCELHVKGFADHVILKGEKLRPNTVICDNLVFASADNVVTAVVEMKSRSVDATEVLGQLGSGSAVAAKLLNDHGAPPHKRPFYPILLCESCHPMERRELSRRRVGFQGGRYDIIVKTRVASLSDLVDHLG